MTRSTHLSIQRASAAAMTMALAASAGWGAQLESSDYFCVEGEESWNGSGSGISGRAEFGNLTDDGVIDTVVLRDGVPYLLYGTVGYRRHQELLLGPGETVADFAIYPEVNPDRTDALFTAGSAGIDQWRWNAASEGFDRTVIASAWGPMERVAVTSLSSSYDLVVAVGADGMSRWMLFSSLNGNFTFSAWSFDLGPDVGQLELGDFDGDGGPELAVVNDDKLNFHELGAGYIGTLDRPVSGAGDDHTTDALTVIPTESGDSDRVAWFLNPTSADSSLIVGDLSGADEPVQLGSARAQWAAGGDVDGDGRTDLVASLDRSGVVLVLLQGYSAATFDLAGSFEMGTSGGGDSTAGVALGDFNYDGDLDVFTVNEDSESIRLFGGVASDADGLIVNVDGDSAVIYPPFSSYAFMLELPMTGPAAIPADANKLRVTTWSGSTSSFPSVLDFQPVDVFNDPLPGSFPFTDYYLLSLAQNNDYRFVELRMVRDVAGLPPKAYPAQKMFLTLDQTVMDAFIAGYQGTGMAGSDCKAASAGQGEPKPVKPGVRIRLPDIPL